MSWKNEEMNTQPVGRVHDLLFLAVDEVASLWYHYEPHYEPRYSHYSD